MHAGAGLGREVIGVLRQPSLFYACFLMKYRPVPPQVGYSPQAFTSGATGPASGPRTQPWKWL